MSTKGEQVTDAASKGGYVYVVVQETPNGDRGGLERQVLDLYADAGQAILRAAQTAGPEATVGTVDLGDIQKGLVYRVSISQPRTTFWHVQRMKVH